MRNYDFDINAGVGSFALPEDEPADFPALGEAVREAGYELLWLDATIRGVLGPPPDPGHAGPPVLEVASTGQTFELLEGESEAERAAFRRLASWLDRPGRKVAITGRVQAPALRGPPALRVREIRPR